MVRNISILFLRQFIPLLIQGIVYSAVSVFSPLWEAIKGLWGQSHLIAVGWMKFISRSKMDSRFEKAMYLAIRYISFLLMVICIKFIMDGLTWIVKGILRI